MARTRRATQRPARAASRQSQPLPLRASLSRKSKPTASLNVDDSSDSSGDDHSDSDVHPVLDASDDDDGTDSGIGPVDDDVKVRRSSRKRKRSTPAAPRTPRKTSRAVKKPATRKRAKTSTPKSSAKKQRQKPPSRPHTPAKKKHDVDTQIPPGVIPDWTDPRIPYRAWVEVFLHASENGADTGWLLRASTVCKAFFEPAMAALYQNPTPRNLAKIKKLVTVLATSPEETMVNYRSKVKALFVDIQEFPLGVIHDIIRPLHRMRELVIFTSLDQPPYRNLDKPIRWHYPQELFAALDPTITTAAPDEGRMIDHANTHTILLKSWEWNSRLLGKYVTDMADISRIHQLPSFAGIRKLGFTNFQLPSLHKTVKDDDEDGKEQLYQEDAHAIDSIANSISKLENLKHLIFEASQILNERLLPQLPKTLSRLDLINCWEVNSDELAAFLRTHGNSIGTLNLMHNQSLDMGFLTDLADTCPRLRDLRMNLSYYRHHEWVIDSDPMYEQALLPHQVPMWPQSLHLVEMEHVRLWSLEAAEMFLQSFINSAPELPNLRHLSIKYGLDIPWQDRANMRKKWYEKLTKVFLRPWTPPKLFTTLRPQLPAAAPAGTSSSPAQRGRPKKPQDWKPSPLSRRSGRIAATSDSDRGAAGRLRKNSRPLYRDPDTDEDEVEFTDDEVFFNPDAKKQELADDNQDLSDNDASNAPFVQGLCETVNILFDNQKASEMQYGMEDFFDEDSESSGEEWNSNNDVDEDDSVFVWR